MKEYKYQGETFQVDDSGGCEIKVSDGQNTYQSRRTMTGQVCTRFPPSEAVGGGTQFSERVR